MRINDDIPWGPGRIVWPSAQPMYTAARRWRDESLIADRSLFGGHVLDSARAVDELERDFVNNLDTGTGTFESKFRTQLVEVHPDTVQVAAELLYVHALIASTASWSPQRKLALINSVVGFRDTGVSPVPPDLEVPLAGGAVNTGQAYGTYRWKMVVYLIKVFGAIKKLSPSDRLEAVSSLLSLRQSTSSVDTQTVWTQQFALEHLLFPAEAPPVVSRDDRAVIAQTFGGTDEDVVDVCAQLTPNVSYGAHAMVNPYATPYHQRWRPNPEEQVFAGWALRVLSTVDLDAAERAYKMERAPLIKLAIQEAVRGDDPEPALRTALQGFNVVDYRVTDTFLNFAKSRRADVSAALVALQDEPGPQSIDRFLDHVPFDDLPGMGARLSLASALLLGCDPERLPPWRETAAGTLRRLTGGYSGEAAAPAGEMYLLFLERLDAVMEALRAVNDVSDVVTLRDRLDVQGLAWVIVNYDLTPDAWTSADLEAYNAWRLGKRGSRKSRPPVTAPAPAPAPVSHGPGADLAGTSRPESLEELAAELWLDDPGLRWLEETVEALNLKRQVILQGPPGTGKTYYAMAIARFVAGSDDRVKIVQFHPGTSYEDFVQGLRPSPADPTSFVVLDGPLLRIADEAERHPDQTYVLVIDEINRGNVAAVFGELYFLLEYRGETVTLTYGGERKLPTNLLIIGTMNTADRSITSLDAALRRRFFVRDLRPDQAPVDGSLRRLLRESAPQLSWLADVLERANGLIGDPDQFIGPSHFMGDQLDETAARRAWNYSVIPALAELFYGQKERLVDLDFDVLKDAVTGVERAAAAD